MLSCTSSFLKFWKTHFVAWKKHQNCSCLAHYCIINLSSKNPFSFLFFYTFGHLVLSKAIGIWKLSRGHSFSLLLWSKTEFFSISRTVDFITTFGNTCWHLISFCLILLLHSFGCILSTVLSKWERKINSSFSKTLYQNNPKCFLKCRFQEH